MTLWVAVYLLLTIASMVAMYWIGAAVERARSAATIEAMRTRAIEIITDFSKEVTQVATTAANDSVQELIGKFGAAVGDVETTVKEYGAKVTAELDAMHKRLFWASFDMVKSLQFAVIAFFRDKYHIEVSAEDWDTLMLEHALPVMAAKLKAEQLIDKAVRENEGDTGGK